MKTLISFFVILLMMLVSCTKDQFVQEENLELKKAKVPIPMKADFCATPDMTSPMMPIPIPGLDPNDPKNYLPSKMFVSGTATHSGKVNAEKSICEVTSLELVIEGTSPENFMYFLLQKGIGTMTAANGDSYPITWWGKTSMADWTYIGEVTMLPGTGKFTGMTGLANMIGAVDLVAGTNCWKADGFMEYAR